MQMRKIMPVLAISVGLAVVPGPGTAVELGLTPSHVFSLWTNINAALTRLIRTVTPSDFRRNRGHRAADPRDRP